VDEKEIIPLVYGFLRGMKAYRKACEEVEEYLNSKEEKKIDPELEDFIENYRKAKKLLSFVENFLE
jgi:uncharacterized Fe-S cluster-containing protein